MSNPQTYRGWSISFEYGRYVGIGPNYDASYEGPEDGWVGSGDIADARTLEDLRAEIDDAIALAEAGQ